MLDFINDEYLTVRIDSTKLGQTLPDWFSNIICLLCNYYGLETNPYYLINSDPELVDTYLRACGLEFEKFSLEKLESVEMSAWNTPIKIIPQGYVFKSNPKLTELLLKYGTE